MTETRTKKKLLFVDDDPAMVKVVGKILDSALGPQVIEFHEAMSGERGLQQVQELKPDIVMCDIHMPGINGFEFCKKIRQSALPATVILMSAYDENEDTRSRPRKPGRTPI